jgi:uncharacterized protein
LRLASALNRNRLFINEKPKSYRIPGATAKTVKLKLHLSQNARRNTVTAYGQGYVAVNGKRYESSLVVLPDRVISDWNVTSVENLSEGTVGELAQLRPELVLLGTGDSLHFPDSKLLTVLLAAGIGTEVMDTHAACRTYNILAQEGRNVAAALVIPPKGA